MIIEHGKGNALPENQQNIGILWAEDVQGILQAEEAEGRQTLRQYDAALEEALAEKMRAFDEERGKAGSKRRTGSAEADTAWWTKEVSEWGLMDDLYFGFTPEKPYFFYDRKYI
jgi:hypothetical protein